MKISPLSQKSIFQIVGRRIVAAILLVAAFAAGQEYFEATGQTVLFRLTAGGNGAWDGTVSEQSSLLTSRQVLSVWPNPARGGATIRLGAFRGPVEIAVYNTSGKKVFMAKPVSTTALRLPDGIANGVFIVSLIQNGRRLKSCPFVVVK